MGACEHASMRNPVGELHEFRARARRRLVVCVLTVVTSSAACVESSDRDDEDRAERERDAELPSADEPRLDVGGSGSSSQSESPFGIDGGPVSLPVSLEWTDLGEEGSGEVEGGNAALRIANLRDTPITALLTAIWSSGAARASSGLETVTIAANDSVEVHVALLPPGEDLGNVWSSHNLRVEAVVADGADVTVVDEIALGHYQPPPLYFHVRPDGRFQVYNELSLKADFNAGLIAEQSLVDGNIIEVPEGSELEAVVVGAEG